jgi:CPA2 family monovalent cation:H+ antiporter-2
MIYTNELQSQGSRPCSATSNSEILLHVGLEDARALVVTVPNETAAELIVTAAHAIAPTCPSSSAPPADRLDNLFHLARATLSTPKWKVGWRCCG